MSNFVPRVSIDLTETPRTGPAQVLFRVQEQDKKVIAKAADALGLKDAEFLRIVAVNSAKAVLSELQVAKVEEEGTVADAAKQLDKAIDTMKRVRRAPVFNPDLPPGVTEDDR